MKSLTDAQIDGLYGSQYAPLPGVELVRIPESAHLIMLAPSCRPFIITLY